MDNQSAYSGPTLAIVIGHRTVDKVRADTSISQGGKLSPKLWNFDIRDLSRAVGEDACLLAYADDCNLWFEIDALAYTDRQAFIDHVNTVLSRLSDWGIENRTAFEPDKMAMMVVSNKKTPFDPTGIVFEGFPVKQVHSVKAVGFTFDCKMSWAEMVATKAKKARARVAALRRMSGFLDSRNLKLMYTAFVRPVMEYGSMLYASAAPSHLAKLDRVQAAAARIGRFEVTSLEARRHAAIAAFALKLLDQPTRPLLLQLTPVLVEVEKSRTRTGGLQIKPVISTQSLNNFKRSFFGILPVIWGEIPHALVLKGAKSSWSKIRSQVKKVFTKSAV
jgi:hypothetical protein